MKKFLLMLAMMLPCLGAWAQEPVLELDKFQIGTTYPYLLSDADAEKVYALDDLTIAVQINTKAVSGRMALFATSDPTQAVNTNAEGMNSRYVAYGMNGSDGGYLASWRGNDRFTGGGGITANTENLVVVYVVNPTNKTFKCYVNGACKVDKVNAHTDGFMSGYEIATPKMVKADHENAKIYIGGGKYLNNSSAEANGEVFNGIIKGVKVYSGALTAEQISAITFPTYVEDVEDFENGKVYTFITKRGWMGAKADNNKVISTVYTANNVTGSKIDANFQWTVYKSENNNYYLYNLGKGMFMGKESRNNTAVPFVATPDTKGLVFKKSSHVLYPIMFSTDNAAVVNHSGNHASGVVSWTGGWNNLTDEGSNHSVELVAELDEATLTKIEEAVAAYELTNTYEVSLLDAAITKANTLFGQITIGSNVGQYSSTIADYQTRFEEIVNFRSGIQNNSTPTPAEVQAKVDEVEELIASFSLNMPVSGKFYRIKNNGGTGYLSAGTGTGRSQFVAGIGEQASSIFYLDGNKLVSYTTGLYLAESGNFVNYTETVGASAGTTFAFSAAPVVGKYLISFKDGNRSFYSDNVGNSNAAGSGQTGDSYRFTLEEVTWLPIPVNVEAGWTTLYSPVELALSFNRFKAYTATSIEGNSVVLEEQTVVPANVGVVLELQEGAEVQNGCVFLEIKATETEATSLLEGTYADTYVAKDAYVLSRQMIEEEFVVGFFKATLNQQNNTSFLNNGFKAYLPTTQGASMQVLRFNFGGNTTAIESVVAPSFDANAPIYDLSGRRVVNTVKGGLYIQNGKKFIVK